MKNWLVALQTPYNSIKFITNIDTTYTYLPYYDFFNKMNSVYIQDAFKFRKTLDEIGRIVVLNMDTGEWKKQPINIEVNHTTEELLEYNEQFKEKENKNDKINNFKKFIKQFVRNK